LDRINLADFGHGTLNQRDQHPNFQKLKQHAAHNRDNFESRQWAKSFTGSEW
jgi:hypothetical protein